MLTFSQADAVLVEAFTPKLSAAGFTFAGKRTWARTGKPHICELMRLFHTKGAGITPFWGIVLDFAPEVTGTRLKWTRRPQDACLDFQWFPTDYDEACRVEAEAAHKKLMNAIRPSTIFNRLIDADRSSAILTPFQKVNKRTLVSDKWYANRLDEIDVFTRRAIELAELTAAEAVPFFDRIRDLNSVAGLYAFQLSYPYLGLGFYNHIQPPLAYPFLLARVGRSMEARRAYETYCTKFSVTELMRPKIDVAFEEALAKPLATRL